MSWLKLNIFREANRRLISSPNHLVETSLKRCVNLLEFKMCVKTSSSLKGRMLDKLELQVSFFLFKVMIIYKD